MYALESAPSGGHLTENMEHANLYNLDSASISAYSHPSNHSPYNNAAVNSLLLPSSATYHHSLDLNPGSQHEQNGQHAAMDTNEAHLRIPTSG